MERVQTRPRPGTLEDLITQFRGSPEYRTEISDKTQRDYDRYLELLRPYGDLAVGEMTHRFVLEERDRLSDRPRSANYFLQVVRRLYSFGMDRGLVDSNPAQRSKMLKTKGEYRAWSDEDCRAFEDSKPPPAMVRAYMIGLYTGQRESDILPMVVSQDKGASIELVQHKTGKRLRIPVHKRLREFLDAQAYENLLMVTTKTGRPCRADYFRHEFRKALDGAGLSHLHFHGLRHTAGKNLAEAGCSDRQIRAVLGHATPSMTVRYTSEADQFREARAAMAKLQRNKKASESD